jgi:glycosyltransferase involved in cell wall biosynthesis
MKVLIVGNFEFPYGSAAASRVRNIALGLSESGAAVGVLTISDYQKLEEGSSIGQWERISFQNYFLPSRNFLTRKISKVLGIIGLWGGLLREFKETEDSVVLIYGRDFWINFPVLLLSRIFRKKIFFEVCEWFSFGGSDGHKSLNTFIRDWLSRNIAARMSDGVVAISHYIAQKYNHFGLKTLVIPSLIRVNGADAAYSNKREGELNVIYSGKCKPYDRVDMLLGAIKTLRSVHHVPVNLVIIGSDGRSSDSKVHYEYCQLHDDLKAAVKFKGWLSEADYKTSLAQADCLVIPRPLVRANLASFPTRLPEFLITRLPVLISDVGDIDCYLKSGEHYIKVKNGLESELVAAILWVWNNREAASQIGDKGREQALRVFDYRQHGRRIHQFISNPVGQK